ncbi:FkbM family methyltransferase [Planctellipticum variicoloris]|uniref:FkbM family methyltransferase n=1 Tax=Planctellipticum variicoloris TaxID=3064265 RepID=UPI0030140CD6|nr:FkbM family methyltransferase [Planctomycetaceae bacterium SH412]
MHRAAEQLRAYNRFRQRYPMWGALLPWARRSVKGFLRRNVVQELIRTDNDFLIPVDSSEATTRRVQVQGSFDSSLEWIIRRYAKPGTAAVDVGANLGYLSLVMSDRVGSQGCVYAVEPNPALHGYLTRLLQLNAIDNVQLARYACSQAAGTLRLAVDRADHTQFCISEDGGCQVEALPLDSLLASNALPVSLLKIDVEGHEFEVLAGARATLQRHRPTVVFETGLHTSSQVDSIGQILEDADYEVVGVIHDWGVDEQPLSTRMTTRSHCNVLALPRSRSAAVVSRAA